MLRSDVANGGALSGAPSLDLWDAPYTLSDDFVNEAVDVAMQSAPLAKPSVTEYQPRTLPVMQTSVLIVVLQHYERYEVEKCLLEVGENRYLQMLLVQIVCALPFLLRLQRRSLFILSHALWRCQRFEYPSM